MLHLSLYTCITTSLLADRSLDKSNRSEKETPGQVCSTDLSLVEWLGFYCYIDETLSGVFSCISVSGSLELMLVVIDLSWLLTAGWSHDNTNKVAEL